MAAKAKTSLILSATIAALALFGAAPAQAADEHLFDPVLSLEGDCKGEDGVVDPSCVGEPPAYPPGAAPKAFNMPCGTATDLQGNVYVSNPASKNGGESYGLGEINIFDPAGKFITKVPNENGPCEIAVDTQGNVYVTEEEQQEVGEFGWRFVDRYEPDSYPPTEATEYTLGARFEFMVQEPNAEVPGGTPHSIKCSRPVSIAIDPSNDHLYMSKEGCRIEEYGSAAEGTPLNPLLECCIGEATFKSFNTRGRVGIDVYGGNHDVHASVIAQAGPDSIAKVLSFDGTTGELKCDLRGSGVGSHPVFDFGGSGTGVAVDQSNGDLYVYDAGSTAIAQFGPGGEGCPQFIGELPPPPKPLVAARPDLAVDAPLVKGEAGYESPNEGYVYVTSGDTASNSHLWAFEPRVTGGPEVRDQSVDAVTETEALLTAELNPNALETTYHFEYTTQASFEAKGYEGAISVPVPDLSAGAGGSFVAVSATAAGLQPDTAYRFRLVASSCEAEEADPDECLTVGEGDPGEEGEEATFSTYPLGVPGLADGRAYELVTPPDTHGQVPTMRTLGDVFGRAGFPSTMASPDGGSLLFATVTGALPGIGGGGAKDTYEARRDPVNGWQTTFTGLTGAQAEAPQVGGVSPEHHYAFWSVYPGKGSFASTVPFTVFNYLRVPPGAPEPSPNCQPAAEPEGRFEWIGCGSLGFEPQAVGKWISPGGEHVIFFIAEVLSGVPALQLEPCGPPSGTGAIYDRTPGGATHCVSLLPGDVTPTDNAIYEGVSADGSAVAFRIEGDDNLYVRRDNAETLIVAGGDPTFGGLSRDGDRVFFLKDASGTPIPRGELFACDLDEGSCAGEGAHEATQIGSGGDSAQVNVSADGSHAYFVSKAVLTGEEDNGHGAKAQAGKENLYVWDGSSVRFLATVSDLDVGGEGAFSVGLGLWVNNVLSDSPGYNDGPGKDPSRAAPDGSVFLFQSHEDLTGYESSGHSQVFRYDAEAEGGERLICISCNPTGVPAASDARLQEDSHGDELLALPPVNPLMAIASLTADGQRAFFESPERLVSGDLDGLRDVYEWRAQGAADCKRAAGCLSLISSGKSGADEYLYAMTPDGSDVFFVSTDTLVPQDPDETYSIYDARVGGGFPPPPPPPGDCLGEACQPAVAAPNDPTPATSSHRGPGNPSTGPSRPRCPKGKRKVRRAGKTRCVKRQSKKHHKRNHNRRGQR